MPALAFVTQPIGNRHTYVVEKDLGKNLFTIHAFDRAASHARRIEREQDQAHATMAFAARLAKQPERPVGKHCAA